MTTHTTAPTREDERAPEDAMREDVAKAMDRANEDFYSRPIGNVMKDGPEGYWGHQADAAIAAAEPHLKARHRAELYAELIAEAATLEYTDDGFFNFPGKPLPSWGLIDEWLIHRQQADATRRDGSEK